MGEVVFNAAVLVGLLVLYPFILRWTYGLQSDPFDSRHVARRGNSRIYVFTVPGLAIVQIVRLISEISHFR